MENSVQRKLGEMIYLKALYPRSGFDIDLDEETWEEIYNDIGEAAMEEFRKLRKVTQ